MLERTVGFVRMADGTKEDYELLNAVAAEDPVPVADNVLGLLKGLKGHAGGFRVDRYTHSLQTATRAFRDGADEEMLCVALLHDVGDMHAPGNHSGFAAAVLKPYVSGNNHWLVLHHGFFQGYHYAHYRGGDRNARDRYRDHPAFETTINFCERWDQNSFDPDYDTMPLEAFEPTVRRLLAKPTHLAA